jgi:threonine dehydrogenase-like Zn-dependent dehydrogenase
VTPAVCWVEDRPATWKGSADENVKSYNREPRDLIHAGKAKPSWIVSHHLSLGKAPDAYPHFDARDDGWTKWFCIPNGHSG